MKYVYLLRSKTKPAKSYVGVTSDPGRRLQEHNRGHVLHTRKFAPWGLVAYVAFQNAQPASAFEAYLKTGSGRAFAKRHFLGWEPDKPGPVKGQPLAED